MSRKIIKRVFIILIVFGVVLSPQTLSPLYSGFGGGSKEITIANGVIDGKRKVEYSCGIRNHSFCFDYVLSVDGVEHFVDKSLFSNNTIGQTVKLTSFESVRQPYLWEIILALYSMFCLCVIFSVSLYRGVMLIYWCFISDTKLTFKEWRKT